MNRIILLSSLIISTLVTVAQPLAVDSAQDIVNARQIEIATGNGVFKIVHIGDSHIQADWFSGKVRDLLQEQYGNAGKGLLFPYKQIRTNGPNTFSSFSKTPFVPGKIVKCRTACDIGIAAYNAYMKPGQSVVFNLRRDTAMQYISAIYQSGYGGSLTINSDQDTSNYRTQSAGDYFITSYKQQVGTVFSIQANDLCTLNGLVASNGQPGLLYYTIGANGATFNNYNNSDLFFRQLRSLQPDLVIVSLGTNESVSDITADSFYMQVNTFHEKLKQACGHSGVIYTTPADNNLRKVHTIRKKVKGKWRRKKVVHYVNNEKLELLRETMIAFCKANTIMYWDLYQAMGGDGSMRNWVNSGYAARDHIHFSKGGYELQGKLMFDALQKIIIRK